VALLAFWFQIAITRYLTPATQLTESYVILTPERTQPCADIQEPMALRDCEHREGAITATAIAVKLNADRATAIAVYDCTENNVAHPEVCRRDP